MNKLRGEVEIELDGLGKRRACLNMNGMILVQQELGLASFEELLQRLSPPPEEDKAGKKKPRRRDYAMARAVLWAAMREFDPSLTLEDVGRCVTWGNLAQALDAVAIIIMAGMDLDATAGFSEAAAETPEPEEERAEAA